MIIYINGSYLHNNILFTVFKYKYKIKSEKNKYPAIKVSNKLK